MTTKPLAIARFLLPVLVAALPLNPASAAIVNNGSFEIASPGSSLPTGDGTSLPVGSTAIAGWTVIGSNSGHDLAWSSNQNPFNLFTPFGDYFVDLSGYTDAAPYVGLSQTISLSVGAAYVLSFDLGVDQSSSIYSGPIGVTASVGSTTQIFTGYNPAGVGNIWQSFSLDFVATSSNTTISITGLQGNQYIGLDNVAVNIVPEPSTWAMLGLGAVGAGVVALRRRTAQP